MSDGMRKKKNPTKADYQIAFQQQKAECCQLIEHLQQMGPMLEETMAICFGILKLARKVSKDMEMVVAMDQANTDQVKAALNQMCDMTVHYAAQHRAQSDPNWNPAQMAVKKDIIPDTVLADFDETAEPEPDDTKCTACDWTGYARDVVKTDAGFACCPVCGKMVGEIIPE